ncbi:acetyl-CoA synthetase-like protein [Parathielavia appendiculata]|uniref:Acetyl-CoA synthetase-like protein n=1 Tax=Parathielavia appendiculata TaxID=2587402 RepID=A0AAN6UAT9_9PEZI|nr:acetyl-CoA synthetase-like protein [Parathielavia appendiculata]
MPYPSTFPHLDIPKNVDLWTLLFGDRLRDFPPAKEILTCAETGRSYTWAELRRASIEFGQGLKEHWGWRKGEVLTFYTPNSIDTPILTLGALWAGGTVSPANPLYTADELAFQLHNAGAKGLITQAANLPTAISAARKANLPLDRILLLGTHHGPAHRIHHFTNLLTPPRTTTAIKPASINPKRDIAFLVYSSGTTGLPKGVCLTHHNMVSNLLQASYVEGSQWRSRGGADGKQLGILPFFHIFGLTSGVLLSVYEGWQLVVLERFDMTKALRAIERYRITFAYVPPPVVLAFGKHPGVEGFDLSSLKLLHSGAAPLTRELTEAVWNRLKVPVKQGFGLSETCAFVCCQVVDEWAKFMGSVGKLMPNMEARIVGEEGRDVEEGEAGELWLKGPNVFPGYFSNPERTKEAFSSDGYFKTGDVFKRDKHGNFYCVDRIKELIKYNGYPVPPAELEGILLGHKEVADACVIGVEDQVNATEVPRAYVVLRDRGEASEAKAQELAEWVAAQVAPHKKLRGGIRFVDQVPKSPSGKVLRRVMREQAKKEQWDSGAKL